MNIEKYKFYSVLKNEDATPYVGSNVLIIADGLGGAGGYTHSATPTKDEIFKSAFYDLDLEKAASIASELEEWAMPIASGKPTTSALWSSHIAIARCAYALEFHEDFVDCDLSDEATRDKLADFITDGLNNTAKQFDLQKGSFDNQKLLPTTLAFIRYKVDEQSNIVTAETVWAGDSRCYLLTKDGLKQLSIDDEDSSGALTNLFSVGNRKAKLHYRKYEIETPCVLIGSSDGIFDPFEPVDNLGVESTLLGHLQEATSYDELMKNLCELYGDIHSDDATMAFVSVGFEDYASLKSTLFERSEYISSITNKYRETKSAMEILAKPEEDILGYVKTRTDNKFERIMRAILENYADAENCIYTKELCGAIDSRIMQINEQRSRQSILSALNKLQADKTSCVFDPNSIFRAELSKDVPSETIGLIKSVKESYKKIQDVKAQKDKKAAALEKRLELYAKLVAFEKSGIDTFHLWLEDKDGNPAKANKIIRGVYDVMRIETEFTNFCNGKRNAPLTGVDDIRIKDLKILAQEINRFIIDNRGIFDKSDDSFDEEISNHTKKYLEDLDEIFEQLKKDENQPCLKDILTSTVIDEYGLFKEQNISVDDKLRVLTADKAEFVEIIVNALIQTCEHVSIIDDNYTPSRLNEFRTYYKLKDRSTADVDEFKQTLNAILAEYERLIVG